MNNLTINLPSRMKAALATRYGGPEVIKIREVPLPELMPNMVMVRVEAGAVNSADVRTRGLQADEPMKILMRLVLGFSKPRRPILGTVFAGTVVAVGDDVTACKINDKIFGATPGMGFGCHAQYVAISQDSAFALMPEGADPGDIVSLVFGGATALYFLEKAGASSGKNALIYGASGAVGSMAVQVARNLGMRVTGVAGGKNEDLVLSLGAEKFLDYTQPDFRLPLSSYDLVFDAVGKLPKKVAKQSLRLGGVYATVGGISVSKETKEHMKRLADWYVSGSLRPVIQERFAFENIRDAHRVVDTGHKRGSVVLLMHQEERI